MAHLKRGLLVPIGLSALLILSGWGFLVHRTTTQLAVYQLPSSLRAFFYENMDTLVRASVRPDQRRGSDPAEGTRHFINLETFGDSAAWKMPLYWNEAVARYTRDTLLKYGHVPYWVITMKDRLTGAFRSGQPDSILFYAADLAHYIQDAHVPLHATTNHDGQLTNQRGLHSLWESFIPELELNNYNLYNGHRATYLSNPELSIWEAVRRAHRLVPQLLEEERAASVGFADTAKYRVQVRNGRESRSYTTAFARAYSARLGQTVNQQLLLSAGLVADFWYTAWVDAGRPSPARWYRDGFVKAEKKALKKELRAYKDNTLLKERLLVARQGAGAGSD